MIFVVKVQLKKLSGWILNCFLITKKGFLLTISFKKLDIKGSFLVSLSSIPLSRHTEFNAEQRKKYRFLFILATSSAPCRMKRQTQTTTIC